MKISHVFFPFLLLCLVSVGCQTKRKRPAKKISVERGITMKKKVGLLPFYNQSPYGGDDLAVVAMEELRLEVVKTGEFQFENDFILELGADFNNSQSLFNGANVKIGTLAKKAKKSGLNYLVYGRVSEARSRTKKDDIGLVRKKRHFADVTVELHLFDVMQGKDIFADFFRASVDDESHQLFKPEIKDEILDRQELLRYAAKMAIRKSLPKFMDLGKRIEWTGRVAKIVGGKIYLNAGARSGLGVGDIVKVLTEGREIFDPETGALIGTSKGEVKGTLEVMEFFGPDGSIAILHSGGTVTEGDYIQLY